MMSRVREAEDAWIDRTLVFCDLEQKLMRPLRCGSTAAFAVAAAAHHEAVGDDAKAWAGRRGLFDRECRGCNEGAALLHSGIPHERAIG
jgi:hypothetical protein